MGRSRKVPGGVHLELDFGILPRRLREVTGAFFDVQPSSLLSADSSNSMYKI